MYYQRELPGERKGALLSLVRISRVNSRGVAETG